ncbi:DUF4412 domain-containing protein [Roseicella sp. DB1501]|uniref:DUF4412 domain-containing protein n=1 Tax=Roseicella sp. DB1501 TaxID=2730925 RepID=UPI0014915BFC|nr:DUF4412 domain-containing protein [Roseicella sp. DB1501]NOG73260.1 DUF4412 domain-containing protein [Roseicella sp. DB1501]
MRPAILCAMLLAAGPALAQADGPLPAPVRDVAVTYRATGEKEQEIRMAWLVAQGRFRMETPGGALLHDMRSRRTTILMTEQRMFVEGSDEDRGPGIGLVPPGSRVARLGTDRIAGYDCTVWRIEPPKDSEGDEARANEACVTADGVPLRVVEIEGGEEVGRTVATRVDYARQDPAQFEVPPGYRPFDPQAAAPAR